MGPTAGPIPPPLTSAPPSNQTLTVAAVTAASILAAVFLFLTYYTVLLRQRSSLRLPPPPSAPHTAPHHPWLIHTVGLDESLIRSIPVVPYSGDPPSDCPVCLSELVPGEYVRVLPTCSHAFHLPCIDTWLLSHVTCPLCRSPFSLPPGPVVDLADDPIDVPVDVAEGSLSGEAVPVDSAAIIGVSGENSSSGDADKEEEGVERPTSSGGVGFFSRLRASRSSSVLPL